MATKYDFHFPPTPSALQSAKAIFQHTHIDGLLQQSPKRNYDELETTVDSRRNLKKELATLHESKNVKYQN